LSDKIGLVISSPVLHVSVQNVGYGGEGNGEVSKKFLVGLRIGRKENNMGFVDKCM